MFCKKKSDFKSWGGQFNTMSPPIKKLGGTCPQCPPPRDAPVSKRETYTFRESVKYLVQFDIIVPIREILFFSFQQA